MEGGHVSRAVTNRVADGHLGNLDGGGLVGGAGGLGIGLGLGLGCGLLVAGGDFRVDDGDGIAAEQLGEAVDEGLRGDDGVALLVGLALLRQLAIERVHVRALLNKLPNLNLANLHVSFLSFCYALLGGFN